MSKREESGSKLLTPRELNKMIVEMTRYIPRILKIKPHYIGIREEDKPSSNYTP